MGFDRSKYRAASLDDIKSQQARQEQIRPTNQFNNDSHEVKAGENWFRIAPFHPDKGGSSPFEAKCVTFLDVMVPKRDADKKVIEDEFELKAKPIFNSRVHGGYEHDLVETYLKVANEIAIPNFTSDPNKIKIIKNKLTGFDQVKKKGGLKPIDTWECYAWDKNGKLATLSLKKTVKEQMSELAAQMSSEPNTPDPFSDPEDGIAIIITKTGEGIKTEYKVKLDSVAVNKFNFQLLPTPLTDDQLMQLDKVKSLHERFVGSFKYRDLEYQLEGLENFDKALAKDGYNIGVFQYNEFQDIAEALFNEVPQDTAPAEEEEGVEQSPAPVAPPKPLVKKTTTPAPTVKAPVRKAPPVIQQVDEEEAQEEGQEAEEEVVQEIVPKILKGKTVNVAAKPAPAPVVEEGPKGPHIEAVNDRLAALKAKMGKR